MDNSKPMESGRFATWSAHYHKTFLFIAALTPLPFFFISAQHTDGVWVINSYSELSLFFVLFGWLILSVIALLGVMSSYNHFERPCGDCATTFPLDAQRLAKRWQRAFDMHHRTADAGKALTRATGNRQGLALLLFALGLLTICAIVGTLISLVTVQPWAAPLVISVLLMPLLAFSIPARKHFQLAPWCEGCHNDGWGDGGPEEPSPDIFPLPTLSKTI